jgi:hypothetical protein
VFVASPGVGWGLVADFRTTPDGQKQVVAVDSYIQLLRTLETQQHTGNTLVSFIHGNELSGLCLVQHPEPFDFFMPDAPDTKLVPGFRPIPLDVVQRQIDRAISNTVACLAMARVLLPSLRIVHVLPPPPIESKAQLMSKPEIFQASIEKFGLTPLSIRVKYYQLMAGLMTKALAPFQIEVIAPPPASKNSQGALKDELVYGATHANEAYGAMVVDQMAALERRS